MLRSTLEAKETQGGLRKPEPNVNRWFVTQRASVELDSATETSTLSKSSRGGGCRITVREAFFHPWLKTVEELRGVGFGRVVGARAL